MRKVLTESGVNDDNIRDKKSSQAMEPSKSETRTKTQKGV